MSAIRKTSFDQPDDTIEMKHGRTDVVQVDDEEQAWRSELRPGWNWDEDLEPYAEGAPSCPMTHREYVVSGQIRYLSDSGQEVIGSPGDFLFIEPGHRAWVVGNQNCILIDW